MGTGIHGILGFRHILRHILVLVGPGPAIFIFRARKLHVEVKPDRIGVQRIRRRIHLEAIFDFLEIGIVLRVNTDIQYPALLERRFFAAQRGQPDLVNDLGKIVCWRISIVPEKPSTLSPRVSPMLK